MLTQQDIKLGHRIALGLGLLRGWELTKGSKVTQGLKTYTASRHPLKAVDEREICLWKDKIQKHRGAQLF